MPAPAVPASRIRRVASSPSVPGIRVEADDIGPVGLGCGDRLRTVAGLGDDLDAVARGQDQRGAGPHQVWSSTRAHRITRAQARTR